MTTRARHPDRVDWYLRVLCIVLMCYAIAGKGFAYIGYPPLFIGELLLLAGLFVWVESRLAGLNAAVPAQLLVIAFMLWGLFRTIPGIGKHGVDALRDAVVWGYALFALIVGGLLTAKPQRLANLDRAFFKFVKIFLVATPFAFALGMWLYMHVPALPGSNVPVFGPYKTGDAMMHLTGCFAYLSVCLPSMALIRPWMFAAMGGSIIINFNGRAGLVAFACGALVVTLLRPFNKLALGTILFAVVGLGFFWITDLRIELPPSGRYLSFEQFASNVTSIAGETQREELDGSRHWRLEWWNTIFDYTFHGPYFWTGKGFGINLANSDGFQVHADGSLRSPHNGHLTILARAGVPGFALWCLAQLAWAFMVFDAFVRAARAKERRWTSLFVFLMAYWAAFMANISFDVFLEGPVGGIWFWTLFGVGIAAVRIHRQTPGVLEDFPAETPAKAPAERPRFRRPGVRALPAAPSRRPVRTLQP